LRSRASARGSSATRATWLAGWRSRPFATTWKRMAGWRRWFFAFLGRRSSIGTKHKCERWSDRDLGRCAETGVGLTSMLPGGSSADRLCRSLDWVTSAGLGLAGELPSNRGLDSGQAGDAGVPYSGNDTAGLSHNRECSLLVSRVEVVTQEEFRSVIRIKSRTAFCLHKGRARKGSGGARIGIVRAAQRSAAADRPPWNECFWLNERRIRMESRGSSAW
jgi:hypothetical protein